MKQLLSLIVPISNGIQKRSRPDTIIISVLIGSVHKTMSWQKIVETQWLRTKSYFEDINGPLLIFLIEAMYVQRTYASHK